MKKVLALLSLSVVFSAQAQVSITSADMPVKGDTLRYSTAVPLGFNINLNDTGGNKTWVLDTLTPVMQRVDEYKTAAQVSPIYALTISASAYGYKVTDSLAPPGGSPLPITVKEVYTFYNIKGSSPNDRYIAEGFAAKINGAPIPATYDNEDEIYFFPLQYGNKDTSDYYFDVQVPTLGRMVQEGERITTVDAWGTIKTPFFTTAQSCIRVRSEVNGMDSIISSLPIPAIGIPRQTIDYVWLVRGEHYPALWITTQMVGSNETITSVRYRDTYRSVSVDDITSDNSSVQFKVFPNPAQNALNITISEKNFIAEVFDMQGRSVLNTRDERTIDISSLPQGRYFVRVTNGHQTSYASFVKQ